MPKRNFLTFTWRIKNFSFCWQRNEEEISSPTFFIEGLQGSKWTLFLFPRATRSKQNGSIAIYLQHKREENSPHEIKINYELSVLDCDGIPLEIASFAKCIMQGDDWSAPLLLKQKRVFLEKPNSFLPEDSLTVRCKIWNNSKENTNAERYFAVTQIEVEKASLFGVVKKNDDYRNIYDVKYISETSEISPILVSIHVMFDGPYAKIKPVNNEIMKFCKCKFHFTDDDENQIAYGKSEFFFSSNELPLYNEETIWITPLTYISKYNVTQPNFELENLFLRCEIAYSFGVVSNEIRKIDYSINMFQNGCSIEEKRQEYLPSLKDDLMSLMQNSNYSDITLRTENKSFSVHRNILSARSLFFRTKLDEQNYVRSTIYIGDLDDETLDQVLLFLYTDTIQNIGIKNALKLYTASSRYEIPSLKQKCSSFLQDHLDSSNCCVVLRSADKYQDSDLKKAAQNYILEHEEEVFGFEKCEDFDFSTELKEELMCLKRMKE